MRPLQRTMVTSPTARVFSDSRTAPPFSAWVQVRSRDIIQNQGPTGRALRSSPSESDMIGDSASLLRTRFGLVETW